MLDADIAGFLACGMAGQTAPRQSLRAALVAGLALALLCTQAAADDRRFRLAVPDALRTTGLLEYLLPRFSLKTGVRIEVVPEGAEAAARLGTDAGRAVFVGPSATWRLDLANDHAGAVRFADWLHSKIGQRTVTSYEVAGAAPFSRPEREVVEETAPVFDGDAARGRRVAQARCGRCHVVDPERRMGGIGSTPSFAALRALPDWEGRFRAFYALNPHPAFTQITGITEPFAAHLPPAMIPIEMTPAELEAVLAYVAGLAPADLGAPIHYQ